MRIGIVVSDTYPEITGKMLEKAKERLSHVEIKVIHVPGSFDIPFGVKKIIEEVDGVLTLGAIIQGQTSHDEIIGSAIANSLSHLSLQYSKPVTLGVSGPRMTRGQAIARIDKLAVNAADACLRLLGVKE